MNNITITPKSVEFISNDLTIISNLIAHKWEVVDEHTFHVITEQGVYLLWITENTFNGETYTSSVDLITYLNSF